MKIVLAVLALASGACSQTGAAPPPAPTPSPPGAGACDAAPAQRLVGQAYSAALNEEALRLTGARMSRVIRPGQVVTMEFRADRLNFHVDTDSRIARIVCG